MIFELTKASHRMKSFVVFGILCIGVHLLPSLVHAQNAGERFDQGEQLRLDLEREELRRRLEEGRPGADLKQELPAVPDAEDLCFEINDIQIAGVTLLASGDLNALIDPYLRSCLGEASLKALIAAINAAYAERGYITTRAYLPQQSLGDGKLEITVIEGVIERIELQENGAARADRKAHWKLYGALPFDEGDFLNLRELEQGLDQMGRVPSDTPTVDLAPGEKPGGTVLVIKSQPTNEVRGVATLDNDGSRATGEMRIRLGAEFDNLIGINETLSISALGSSGANAVSASLQIPWGYWSFSANGSYSDQVTTLTPTSDLVTRSIVGSLRAERLVYRDARNKFDVNATLTRRFSERFINVTGLTPQNLTTLRLGVGHEWRGDGEAAFTEAGVTLALPILGSDKNPVSIPAGFPRAEFGKLDVSISYVKALGQHAQFFQSAFAQLPLGGAIRSDEQISIGGWSSVRGYDGLGFTGDWGYFARNELSLRLPPDWIAETDFVFPVWRYLVPRTEFYGFVDAGAARNYGAGQSQGMIGIGGGLRFRTEPVSFELAVSKGLLPLRNSAERDLQTLFSVTWNAF